MNNNQCSWHSTLPLTNIYGANVLPNDNVYGILFPLLTVSMLQILTSWPMSMVQKLLPLTMWCKYFPHGQSSWCKYSPQVQIHAANVLPIDNVHMANVHGSKLPVVPLKPHSHGQEGAGLFWTAPKPFLGTIFLLTWVSNHVIIYWC